jgi:hypothetical protein
MSMESLGALMQNPMAPKKKRRRRNPEPKGMMEAMRRRVVQKPRGDHTAQNMQKAKQMIFKDMPSTRLGGNRSADINWGKIVSASQDRSKRGFPGPNGQRRIPKPPTAAPGSPAVLPATARSNIQEALKRRLKKGKVQPVGHRQARQKIKEFFNS